MPDQGQLDGRENVNVNAGSKASSRRGIVGMCPDAKRMSNTTQKLENWNLDQGDRN
jgi:hypothetical protein